MRMFFFTKNPLLFMKKLLFAFTLILGSAMTVWAQDSTATQGAGSSQSSEAMSQDEKDVNKVSITVNELPSIVRDQLQSQDYSGWTVGNVYRKEKEGKTFYAVEMKNADQTKMVKFDAQGNKIKEKDLDKDKE
jgi:hypothetical protein